MALRPLCLNSYFMSKIPILPTEEQYLNCIRCGLCLAVCPTYRESLRETDSPRGRVALARRGLEGSLVLTPNLFEQMNTCFDCLACNDICPVGIKPAELALAMRDLDLDTALSNLEKEATLLELSSDPNLPPRERLTDLASRVGKEVYVCRSAL